jgi:hypothetical protein
MVAPASATRRAALSAALAVTLAALAWQWLTVHANYQGQWTGLFCIGEKFAGLQQGLPAGYVFPKSPGYDGQFYRVIAHDPWLQTASWRGADNPEYRYRRILVPALAWLAAGGRSAWIDTAYIGTLLVFLFLGTFFLGLWFAREGLPAAAGAVFLFLPGTLISLDRMLPDIALYALLAALLLACRERLTPAAALALALAPLVRDLGFLAIAAAGCYFLALRRWRDTLLAALCALPAAAWYAWLHVSIAAVDAGARGAATVPQMVPKWALIQPAYGLILRMMQPLPYPDLGPVLAFATRALDLMAWTGIALAVGLAVYGWRRWSGSLGGWLITAFLVLFPFASARGFWVDSYSYPRAYTPLLGLLALEAWRRKQWWWALPLALALPRTLVYFANQALGMVRWLLNQP